ncbi:MAG TPA: TonB-dependent receptor [Steroidobacteraceae bacterium]|nr:TonB-dependent receptor [Steroidobacteraceae bacterium]
MNRHAPGIAARALLASVLACLSLWAALAVAQPNERRYEIDIPALPLSQALQLFSQQTGLQHGYLPTSDEEEKLVVPALKGRYTVEEALTALLPAGFTFAWINRRTLVIAPPADPSPGSAKEAVIAKDKQRSELSREQQLSMANGGSNSGSARGPYAFDEEMLVYASKIFDSLDLDEPVTVFDRQDIDASGVATLADLMSYSTMQPYRTPESQLGDGTQVANLRGLGFDTTLVLINGHRITPTASSVAFNAFDLNSIPLGAVERVEIVSDSMSAMHGADAIGGVVNILLREDIPEPRLDVDYGAVAGGGVERHAAFSASTRTDRARGSLVLDYFDRSPLLGRERERFNNQDFTRFGGLDWRSTIAAPGNVRSATPGNLPGLPASYAAIPAIGTATSPTASDFLATAGQQNLESLYAYQGIAYARTRKGLTAQGEYAIVPSTSLYGELMYVDREVSATFEPPALASALVPATNPYNPFGQDVLVDVLLKDLGPRTSTHGSDLVRLGAGARGRIDAWNWDTSLHYSRDRDASVRTGDLDPMRVMTALAATDGDDALNVFGGSGANDPDLLSSLLAAPARTRSQTQVTQGTAYLGGPLFRVPAGDADLKLGGEWREERVQYMLSAPLQGAPASHARSVNAAFGELRIPLVDSAAKIPAAREVSLVLSARIDDYSDVGDSFNPEYALIWRPLASLSLRAAWSQGFRPPPLVDLYLPQLSAPIPTADPARNGELALPIWRAGGNPDLKPSSADSFETSLRFTPPAVPALAIAASYWQIRVDDTIGIPSAALLLNAEERFPERIVRREPTAEDRAAGLPGSLELIDITRLNFGSIDTSGVDFKASMDLDTSAGRFRPELSATWVREFTTSDLVEGSGVDRVGVANLQGTIPRWRAVASLKWNRGGLGVAGSLRYVPAYDDVAAFGGLAGRTVDSQSLFDLQVSLDLGRLAARQSWWRDFELRAGALNLFDEQAPFAEVGSLAGHDASQADLRQRFWYLKLARKF